ncbi:sensor histidine kinase [Tenacibaculum agarivorans]|uniref:sensor histidine kinase n=1 Tax=Tenacibaculum agarivorans TaxID=1908389 RepID=UPI001F443678|nr:sensor histidine kinase [Tenacibaculum agarivorans]
MMHTYGKILNNKVLQNLLVWSVIYIILVATITADNKLIDAFLGILLLCPSVYVNSLFILPVFKKNKIKFFVLFFLNALTFAFLMAVTVQFSLKKEIDIATAQIGNVLGLQLLTLTFSSAIKVARDSFVFAQQEKEAELKLLKAQLNPHFLFNTLNNLYGLSVIKSEKLPSLMLKLSDLLRYSLYETKEVYVALQKEINYLENYVTLEKLRLNDASIRFDKQGDFSKYQIAPMLLIVFVENTFKHLGEDPEVMIHIKMEKNTLIFQCKNSRNASLVEENLEKGRSGIGLNNVKKRLALLYQGKYNLSIHKDEHYFKVDLKVTL